MSKERIDEITLTLKKVMAAMFTVTIASLALIVALSPEAETKTVEEVPQTGMTLEFVEKHLGSSVTEDVRDFNWTKFKGKTFAVRGYVNGVSRDYVFWGTQTVQLFVEDTRLIIDCVGEFGEIERGQEFYCEGTLTEMGRYLGATTLTITSSEEF